jgi:hypothetical protein
VKNATLAGSAALLVALAGLGAWTWWQRRSEGPPAPPAAAASSPLVAAAPAAPPSAPVTAAPPIKHPIAAPEAAAAAPATPTIDAALTALFGRKTVLGLFQTDDFVRRVVATVDNLGRAQASSRLWPMNPAPGRFTVETIRGDTVVSADNGLRYTAYVLALEGAGPKRIYALYRKFYPQFQSAYEQLGYPNGYFNDRLVEVLDLLLATPDRNAALKVRLPVTEGIAPPARPWVLYEFDDPALQNLAAGQKLLLRMGPVNERRVKAQLRELRRLVATGAATP